MRKDSSDIRGAGGPQPSRRPNGIIMGLSLASLVGVGLLGWVLLRDRDSSRGGATRSDVDSRSRAGARAPRRAPVVAGGPAARERAAEAVREALAYNPESLSTTAALPPFDQSAFDRDPAEYLARVEPARCFQTAKPGPDTAPLVSQVSNRAAVQRGVAHPLWVKTTPSAPVTFTAFDGGEFTENGLPSVTVQADAKGLASAHFFAPRGVDGDVNIVAGSPLAAGTQRFLLRVVDQSAETAQLN